MFSFHPTSPSSASSDEETETPTKVDTSGNVCSIERKKRLELLKKRRLEVQGGGKQQRKKTAQLKKRILRRAQKACIPPVEQDPYSTTTKKEEVFDVSQTEAPQKLAAYMNPNPQLNQHTKSETVKNLEREIDSQVERGALKEAQALNERLIQQIKDEKLLEAMEARDFHVKQQAAEAKLSKQKQPKLKWTFVGKERWEAKGNM